jgi:hypothetical protein
MDERNNERWMEKKASKMDERERRWMKRDG